MFLYCSVTVFFFLLFLLEKKIYEKKYLLYISFGLLAILICFRNFTIGNDTQEYVNLFSLSYRTDLLQQLTSRYEIGFLFFNKVVYLINSNPHFYIFISGCIISVGYFKLIRDYSENYVFSVILFLLLGFFSNATNTLREQLAFFFLVFSYDSLKKNRIKSYFLFTFIAFLFHKTSIVFLLSYIAKKIEFNKRNVIAATCFMILAYYFFDSILNILISSLNFYTDYSNSIYRNGIIRQATILQVFIHISIFLFVFILKTQ